MKKIILAVCLLGMIASFSSLHGEKTTFHDSMPPNVASQTYI